MTLPNVPNEVFACEPFVTSVPLARNQITFVHLPDTMNFAEMCGNIRACNLSIARLGVVHPGPPTEPSCQA